MTTIGVAAERAVIAVSVLAAGDVPATGLLAGVPEKLHRLNERCGRQARRGSGVRDQAHALAADRLREIV